MSQQRLDSSRSDVPAVVAAPLGDGVVLVGHSLTGPWLQILDREDARDLAADLITVTTT